MARTITERGLKEFLSLTQRYVLERLAITHRGAALRTCAQALRGHMRASAARACNLLVLGVYSSHAKPCIRFRRELGRRGLAITHGRFPGRRPFSQVMDYRITRKPARSYTHSTPVRLCEFASSRTSVGRSPNVSAGLQVPAQPLG